MSVAQRKRSVAAYPGFESVTPDRSLPPLFHCGHSSVRSIGSGRSTAAINFFVWRSLVQAGAGIHRNLVNGRFRPFAVLERQVAIVNVRRNGRCRDRAIPAQNLLNLTSEAALNQFAQIFQAFKYRRGLGGRPM